MDNRRTGLFCGRCYLKLSVLVTVHLILSTSLLASFVDYDCVYSNSSLSCSELCNVGCFYSLLPSKCDPLSEVYTCRCTLIMYNIHV